MSRSSCGRVISPWSHTVVATSSRARRGCGPPVGRVDHLPPAVRRRPRELGINVSEAAREGLRQAIRRRRAERDREAYLAYTETEDADWDDAEAWGGP